MIVTLAGGVGAARILAGLVQVVDPADVTAVVNVGDDIVLHGLHISPDLDTITYTLAGAIDPETGLGPQRRDLAGHGALLERYGGRRPGSTSATATSPPTSTAPSAWPRAPTWPQVTAEIAAAWDLGLRLLPVTDDRLRTMVTLAADEAGRR